MSDQHIDEYFQQVKTIVDKIDKQQIAALVQALVELRNGGWGLFLLGVGGSAGNASHAVNDFRKLCALEAYAPTDNVSELSARINDEGWDGALAAWLKVSRLSSKDALLIFSVGGGNLAKKVSVNLIQAIDLARERQAKVFGVVLKYCFEYLNMHRAWLAVASYVIHATKLYEKGGTSKKLFVKPYSEMALITITTS